MRKSTIAIACLVVLFGGCAAQQNGVANGGSAANLQKFAAAKAAETAKCNDPNYLFLTPQACVSECHFYGSPAWTTTNDGLVNRGLFVADSFSRQSFAASPFTLTGDKDACLRDCKVNGTAVQACKTLGDWHPDAVIRHFVDVPYINDAGMHRTSWQKEVKPTFNPAYSNQGLIVAIANSGGDVGTTQPLDNMTGNAEFALGQLTSRPMIVASLNALSQAMGQHGPVNMTANLSLAQSFQSVPMKSYGKNPAGVQWPITFDGNITVDQSVN